MDHCFGQLGRLPKCRPVGSLLPAILSRDKGLNGGELTAIHGGSEANPKCGDRIGRFVQLVCIVQFELDALEDCSTSASRG
jgi:hypothetical protein